VHIEAGERSQEHHEQARSGQHPAAASSYRSVGRRGSRRVPHGTKASLSQPRLVRVCGGSRGPPPTTLRHRRRGSAAAVVPGHRVVRPGRRATKDHPVLLSTARDAPVSATVEAWRGHAWGAESADHRSEVPSIRNRDLRLCRAERRIREAHGPQNEPREAAGVR
jgi:hypothetical protein